MLLSIVIPAYNSREYIYECLNSIFSQIVNDIEVILVNDGSTDSTVDIIKKEFEIHIKNNRLKIFHQENSGPGSARNRGLKECKGKYITFLDSDDIILDDYFNEIIPLIFPDKYEIIEHGFKRFINIENINSVKYKKLYSLSGGHKLSTIRNEIFSKTVWYPSIRIFKKTIWNNHRFPEGVFYEDPIAIHEIFLNDYLIYFTNRPLLGYRINPNSTTSLHLAAHLLDLIKFYNSLTEITTPVIIMKIRLARSILYFYHEFQVYDLLVHNVMLNLKILPRNLQVVSNLLPIDLFFFIFPRTYRMINKIRFLWVFKK
jgi:glycosyltransferase involved in cell wall biosynthesis